MYEIVFYEDKNGFSEVEQFIDDLTARAPKNKDARIQLDQLETALNRLERFGPLAGYNFVDKLTNENLGDYPGSQSSFVMRMGREQIRVALSFSKENREDP